MAVNTQFSIAVHILACLGYSQGSASTSADLACSVNTSPSFVRRTLAKLSRSGLVRTSVGKAGASWLARDPEQISLLDVYASINPPRPFAMHAYAPFKACPVSCNIKKSLEKALRRTQKEIERSLAEVRLSEIIGDLKK